MSNIFESDGIKLICGDSLDVLPLVERADCAVTDPPYGIGETAGGPESNAREKGDYGVCFPDTQDYVTSICAPIIVECIRICKRVSMTPGRTNMWHYPAAKDVGCFYQPAATGCSFWGRPTWQPILFYGTAPNQGEQLKPLHYILTEPPSCKAHPCSKPINAWTWLVIKSSREGETVLDPFMGSGTTGIACIRTGRKFIGIEKDPKHFATAVDRIKRELDSQTFDFVKPPPLAQTPDLFTPAQ